MKTIEEIAQICHEVNRGICEGTGDTTQVSWKDSAQWQKDSAIEGVKFRLANPDVGCNVQHDQWTAYKLADGWVYGEVKDADKKTHPCLVPYDQLPPEQKLKDTLFVATVKAFS